GIYFFYNFCYEFLGGVTDFVVSVLLGLSPIAGGWYVVALSVLCVVLGVWVRESVGGGARDAGTTEGSVFFTNR
ncbi:MFS transporter, partial [Enterobacter hormaechei]